ncbi:MAG: aldo/keto reductase [Lachnospirales bacterium]
MVDIKLKDGSTIPKLGIGSWYLGESRYKKDLEALKTALDIGVTLIDTAEMYGSGKAEKLIGEAIKDVDRSKLYLVSKVYPHNAGKNNIRKSLLTSMDNMGVDYLDMYLLHWRGQVPLSETVMCMEELKAEGLIKNWGVSNFDTDDMIELFNVPNGEKCALNQVLYHLGSRGVEYSLMPWLKEHNVPLMAYCPMAQGGDLNRNLLQSKILKSVAQKYDISTQQLLLKFVLEQDNVIAIPRSGNSNHIKENWYIKDVVISKEDLDILESEFPAPSRKTFLDIV